MESNLGARTANCSRRFLEPSQESWKPSLWSMRLCEVAMSRLQGFEVIAAETNYGRILGIMGMDGVQKSGVKTLGKQGKAIGLASFPLVIEPTSSSRFTLRHAFSLVFLPVSSLNGNNNNHNINHGALLVNTAKHSLTGCALYGAEE